MQATNTSMLSQFLFDSAFPNGAYSHSFGLESYISWHEVNNTTSYKLWLERYMLDIFATSEGAVYVIANALRDQKFSLLKLARIANASIASKECRIGSIAMARATLKNTEFMHDDTLKWYNEISKNDNYAHPAIACALLAPDMADEYAYACIKTLTQNATRAIPLSYKKSCELMHESVELAKRSTQKSLELSKQIIENGYFSLKSSDELFSSHHELDIAMFAHENLDFRLFMS